MPCPIHLDPRNWSIPEEPVRGGRNGACRCRVRGWSGAVVVIVVILGIFIVVTGAAVISVFMIFISVIAGQDERAATLVRRNPAGDIAKGVGGI